MDKKLINKINLLLLKTHGAFMKSGDMSRQDYGKSLNKSGEDWIWAYSAADIIKNKVPRRVVGCCGVAKVFAKFAKEEDLDVYVLTTAEFDSWTRVKQGDKTKIHGHQIIAIKTDEGLKAFDPGASKLEFIPANIKPGNFINSVRSKPPYLITAIVKDYEKVDTYQKLFNLYASGDINNPSFTIQPNMEDYDLHINLKNNPMVRY